MNHAGPRRDLVFVGGGHSHILALRRLAMRRPPGVRFTLISESVFTPYSGMLPGLIAGHYRFEETHIDLARFCTRLGIRFVEAKVERVDLDHRRVLLSGRPAIAYDLLSINTGSQPELDSVPGAREYAVPVKPVNGFYQRWSELESRVLSGDQEMPRIVLVGGGAGSVELAMAMRKRLGSHPAHIQLICGASLLETYNRGAVRVVRKALWEQHIEVLEYTRIARVEAGTALSQAGARYDYDELVWCTSAAAATWMRDSGLPCDGGGFLLLDDTLQVRGHSTVFAAGDVATQVAHPRPKAGVYAVRQAPLLAHNLAAALNGQALRKHRPQRRFLSLLSLGGRRAVADRGPFWASGAWVWRWKDRIDRKFMARFTDLPAMAPAASDAEAVMHCGGCGAKLPATMLHGVLDELGRRFPAIVANGQYGDDAAVLQWDAGQSLVQTVDTLRSLLDDPWLMGRLAALHALSDIYAMGARPHSALAHVTLPWAAPALQQRDLEQLMDGAMHELEQASCHLVGGHSLEGPELSIGFTINGAAVPGELLGKGGAKVGDHLLLTKPLGSGVLFAAGAQGAADGRWLSAATAVMLQRNAAAADIARRGGASACTDITGFGLLGHILEMLPATGLRAEIRRGQVPLLAGVEELFAAGYESTLQGGNRAAVAADMDAQELLTPDCQVLFDPQTSGGLLIAVAADLAGTMLQKLRRAGYLQAADIGVLGEQRPGQPRLKLLHR